MLRICSRLSVKLYVAFVVSGRTRVRKNATARSPLLKDSFPRAGPHYRGSAGAPFGRFGKRSIPGGEGIVPFTSQDSGAVVSGVDPPTIETPVVFLKQVSFFSGDSRGIRSVCGSFSSTSLCKGRAVAR